MSFKPSQFCKFMLDNRCGNSRCTFAHHPSELSLYTEQYKTWICKNIDTCRHGVNCVYAHSEEEQKFFSGDIDIVPYIYRNMYPKFEHTGMPREKIPERVSEKSKEPSVRVVQPKITLPIVKKKSTSVSSKSKSWADADDSSEDEQNTTTQPIMEKQVPSASIEREDKPIKEIVSKTKDNSAWSDSEHEEPPVKEDVTEQKDVVSTTEIEQITLSPKAQSTPSRDKPSMTDVDDIIVDVPSTPTSCDAQQQCFQPQLPQMVLVPVDNLNMLFKKLEEMTEVLNAVQRDNIEIRRDNAELLCKVTRLEHNIAK